MNDWKEFTRIYSGGHKQRVLLNRTKVTAVYEEMDELPNRTIKLNEHKCNIETTSNCFLVDATYDDVVSWLKYEDIAAQFKG